MAESTRKSVKLLPNYFQTDKNQKFLSSTIDQLINVPQLERIDGFIGSKLTPNYNPLKDQYINEQSVVRKNYQLEPAIIFRNSSAEITDALGFDDLINELTIQNSPISNIDKVLRSKFYSYDPYIDWDKLINYDQYYWLPFGPANIEINENINIEQEILGKLTFAFNDRIVLSNGLKLLFGDSVFPISYRKKEFIVEGVGEAIQLVEFSKLDVNESIAAIFDETFDQTDFDTYPFDGDRRVPVNPEYITINRASRDLNSWSRYNRWFHKDIIEKTAEYNNVIPVFPNDSRARRPIIEFRANIQLFNFGKIGIPNVDLIDDSTTNAFLNVQNSFGYYIDGVPLEQGNRVIFNADIDDTIRSKIYEVNFVNVNGSSRLQLIEVSTSEQDHSVAVNKGNTYRGTSWYFDESLSKWIFAQQHTQLNQAPLFDLVDENGLSYSLRESSNFLGNKIFGYDIGVGVNDQFLGFPLRYQSIVSIGSFLFKNYFMTESISTTNGDISEIIPTANTFIKINKLNNEFLLINTWKESVDYQIPIVEIQSVEQTTSTIILNSLDKPFDTDINVKAYINDQPLDTTLSITNRSISVEFNRNILPEEVVVLKILTEQTPNQNGFYEIPKGISNNPLNDSIEYFTLSELENHFSSMIEKIDNFQGSVRGSNNLRDLVDYGKYGTRLIINSNPISFTQIFFGKKEHSSIEALKFAANQYNNFKMSFFNQLNYVDSQLTPKDALDKILKEINKNKDNRSNYFYSDMIPYGVDKIIKNFTVSNSNITQYPLFTTFNPSDNEYKSFLVYLNNLQLAKDYDYTIDYIDGVITFHNLLALNDKITIEYFSDTRGSFVPLTPTKLGLYPKFKPEIYIDDSFLEPTKVIKGHDGIIIRAYDDYRDQIILEYELRIFNNLKIDYNLDLFDFNYIIPGYFRSNALSLTDYNSLLEQDFLKWAGQFNVNYTDNISFDDQNSWSWNYKNSYDIQNVELQGSWKGIYTYYFDTAKPHTHPWEMVGFYKKPDWWDNEYGTAPYTSGNDVLWNDLELGYIRGGNNIGINPLYSRPGLSTIIPVNEYGELLSPDEFLAGANGYQDKKANWKFGDFGPSEISWRNSSFWPFVINYISALVDPCAYHSRLFDVGRTKINLLNQITYFLDDLYLDPRKLILDRSNRQISGYGALILERGTFRDQNYISKLQSDLTYVNSNLFYKIGGFVSKEKLQLIIDSVDPQSTSVGAILPPEDYSLIFNISNPIKTVKASGIIIQKLKGKFVVRGYDTTEPYFKILKPIKTSNTRTVSIGGKSASFTDWSNINLNENKAVSEIDLTSVQTNITRFYKEGQIVRYNNVFYRVKTSHSAQATFNNSLFQQLPSLPITGGVTVQSSNLFEDTITKISYGTEFNKIQEVYDLIIGYGAYLESQGFIFDEFNTDFNEVLDWRFSGKEFLFWSTQNWANGHLITISPFSNTLKFIYDSAVVDNLSNEILESNVYKADGRPLDRQNFSTTRDEKLFIINSKNSSEGLFFVKLNLVQKEHALVFNNRTIFNDTIFDIDTGFRQRRIRISGFKTRNWNGDFFSPGFIYDEVIITDWQKFGNYIPGDIVRFNGIYYSAKEKINADETFDFAKWSKLAEKPKSELLPNFEYKINQFEDFYSLDIDNFDLAQQQLAQKLVGYSPRTYLIDIFSNLTSQYKFYQGYIREKGTKNSVTKLEKAILSESNKEISIQEQWAFRIGNYGSYSSYKEIEFILSENTQLDTNYIVKFVETLPTPTNPGISYNLDKDLLIKPDEYDINNLFPTITTSYDDYGFEFRTAGYVLEDDVSATAYNKSSILDIANPENIADNSTIWVGFLENGEWDVYRYTKQSAEIIGVYVNAPGQAITFTTSGTHSLSTGDIVSIINFNDQVNGVYYVTSSTTNTQFSVASELSTIVDEDLVNFGSLYRFQSIRFDDLADLSANTSSYNFSVGELVFIDRNDNDRWGVYQKTTSSWQLVREQSNIVDVQKIKRLALIDTFNEEIVDYLDVIDPLKGKISGLADQEIKYKTLSDPAVYSIGIDTTVLDTNNNWLDDHVGELWWDLSSVKYQLYEQNDEIIRKNNWGKLFPGSSIDIYEWVKSSLLPSEWAAQADTNEGLTQGISGQPKYPDNSVISVKQVFSNITNSFENVYYFWVKNKVTLPITNSRKLDSYRVSQLIADPASIGYQFAEILSNNSISLVNVKNSLVGNRISLNIVYDEIDNRNVKHTEWLLLEQGNPNSQPNELLEKKLFDSLLGHDEQGRLVPDPSLSFRSRYGLGIRPQQTLFKDRSSALRNLTEFTNLVLLENRITGNYNFENLLKSEPIPSFDEREYDGIVEDLDELEFIDTNTFVRAEISCNIENGKIISVSIDNPGYGYSISPKVILKTNKETSANILLEIDQQGRVIDYRIDNPGADFQISPLLEVRSHSYVVRANSEYQGLWTLHSFDYELNEWQRIRSQAYNTPLYWEYVDWVDSTYNKNKDIDYIIQSVYEINSLTAVNVGDYIKVNNIGDGRFIILEKTPADVIGNFNNEYNVVFSERGTIQILDSIWNVTENNYAYDNARYDGTLYDQIPDIEVFNILQSLKNDIFIKDLKIYWNEFFFIAVKYALTEQKLLDWAFKTSLISVKNIEGNLNQSLTYKLLKTENTEEFLREIKPFHTQFKDFNSIFTTVDTYQGNVTDFDLPSYFNDLTNSYTEVNLGDTILTQEPWKQWKDNYLYQIERIELGNLGEGYTSVPSVVITTATGDIGSGATAQAYIEIGKLKEIVITNPGSNYRIPPTVTIVGGNPSVTATAVAIVGTNPIRKNQVQIKFDRYSRTNEIGINTFTESFICDGKKNQFELSWYINADKTEIIPLLDGKLIFASDYEIFQTIDNGNKISIFKFLNLVPREDQIFKITYEKNIDLYNAIDRIDRFYEPTDGMPGKEYSQLMKGMEYPQTNILGLNFNFTQPWDYKGQGIYQGGVWSEYTENYRTAKIISTASRGDFLIYLDNVENIEQGQVINVLNSLTNSVRTGTVVSFVNTNSIILSEWEFPIKSIVSTDTSVGSVITVRTKTPFKSLLKENDLIIISGIPQTEFDEYFYVNEIVSKTIFKITATSVLTTSTPDIISISKITIPAVKKDILAGSRLLETFIEVFDSTGTYQLSTYLNFDEISKINVLVNDIEIDVSTYEITEDDIGNAIVNVYNISTASSTVQVSFFGDPIIEFWNYNDNFSSIDTDIIGGGFISGGLVGAEGIRPEEIIIDGDKFLSENASFAPEELVPGQVVDSLGINVYTKENSGIPVVITGSFPITQTGQQSQFILNIDFQDSTGFIIHFEGQILSRNTSLNWNNSNEYFIQGNILYVAPQTKTGRLQYTIIKLGSDTVLDTNLVVTDQNEALVQSLVNIDDVKSAFVLVNGNEVPLLENVSSFGYVLERVGVDNNRASVKIYNMPLGTKTVQAWFFRNLYPIFNKFHEENIVVSTTPQSNFILSVPPMAMEPASAQVIVEIGTGENKRRLLPPWISYYQATSGIYTYDIDNKNSRAPGTFSLSNVRAYINGRALRPGFDYSVDSVNSQVTIKNSLLNENDALAIMGLVDYDYFISENVLSLSSPVSNEIIQVITFSNHDDLLIRTERFEADLTKRIILSRQILSDNYIWITLNGKPLVNRYDFEVLSDKRVIQFNDWLEINVGDDIVVTTFNPPVFGTDIVAYRIFKDIFDRNYYKRISQPETTRLSKELKYNDTEVQVENSTALLTPNPAKNKPGVIIVDGERIEYFKKSGNVLQQLRRSTLGTGPAFYSQTGTSVIDQSPIQTIPYQDVINIQHFKTSNTNSYIISTSTLTKEESPLRFGNGIILSTLTNAVDQVSVYYGGRPLRKSQLIVHDISKSYNNSTVSLVTLDPEFTINTSTQQIILNIEEGIISDLKLTVVQKLGQLWTTDEQSIIGNTSTNIAKFINDRYAELPDIYYYGGDPVLVDTDYFPIIEDDEDPLEGY